MSATRTYSGSAPFPETTAALQAADTVRLTTREQQRDEYRIRLRRGRISSISLRSGAERLRELVLDPERPLVVIDERGGETPLQLTGPVTLRTRQAPPPGVFPDDQRILLLAVDREPRTATWTIELSAGEVSAIARDGEPVDRDPVTIKGEAVTGAWADGEPRTRTHLLGTDSSGRDLFSRILYGGRISLLVGLVATVVSLVIGVVYGALSGYLGGRWDRLLMNGVDILYGLPFMFLVILLLVNFGRNIFVLFAALGAVQWLTMARIVRAQVLSLRSREFVAAAQLAGATTPIILGRHLIPNCLGPIIIYTTLTVPLVILEESFLAFIGLQVQYGGQALDSWGALVKQGIDEAGGSFERHWLVLWPSLAMCLTLLALNALGSGLRDALDPKLQKGTS